MEEVIQAESAAADEGQGSPDQGRVLNRQHLVLSVLLY